MTEQFAPPTPEVSAVSHRPRIALMGEFSAGKSTLANLLFGREVSPVQVTATQMPPIWYVAGSSGAARVEADGSEVAISDGNLCEAVRQGATALKVSLEADVLEFCDLIDMPGTSDPNLSMDVWEAMLSRVDGVVWCTPASQAWRQSEAALWDEVGYDLAARSLLLVTRMDKIETERDRSRILARVSREAGHLFRSVHGISLTEALQAGDDEAGLSASGAEAFVDALVGMTQDMTKVPADP